MVYSTSDGTVMLYSGSSWADLCSLSAAESTGAASWFRVVDGIPCIPVQDSPAGSATAGSLYYPLGGYSLKISNGSAWYNIRFSDMTSVSTTTGVTMGNDGGLLAIPVLSSDPPGVTAGAFYFNSSTKLLNVNNGTGWIVLGDCICPPQLDGLIVAGTLKPGEELSAGYAYYDREGDSESGTTYQWYRASDSSGTGAVAISGATSGSYTLTDLDNFSYIGVGVTPVAASGTTTGDETFVYQYVEDCPPQADGIIVDGTLVPGQQLTAGYAYYDREGDSESGTTYQWYRASDGSGTGAVAISGATSATYTLTAQDNFSYVGVGVTPVAASGTTTGDETFVYQYVADCPPQLDGLSIAGTLMVGESLSAGYAYYDKEGDSEGTTTYQWYRSINSSGTGALAISGATSDLYTLTDLDEFYYIGVGITPVAVSGTTTGDEAFVYQYVENCPPQADGLTIAGTLTVGQSLMAGYSYYDREGDSEAITTYQWYRASNSSGTGAVAISGATSGSYTLTVSDAGFYIGVGVTPKAVTGYTFGDAVIAYGSSAVSN